MTLLRILPLLVLLSPLCPAVEFKTTTWDFVSRIKRYRFEDKNPDRNDQLMGQASQIALGYAYHGLKLRYGAAGGFLLGPYEKAENGHVQVDMSGTSFEMYLNYLFWGYRGSEHAWGLGFATAYNDLVGRSKSGRLADQSRIQDYATRIRMYTSSLELNLSFLKEPRPVGNQPKDLVTRLEGSCLSMGLEYPWRIDYKTSFLRENAEETTAITRVGKLHGLAVYGGLTVILGL